MRGVRHRDDCDRSGRPGWRERRRGVFDQQIQVAGRAIAASRCPVAASTEGLLVCRRHDFHGISRQQRPYFGGGSARAR